MALGAATQQTLASVREQGAAGAAVGCRPGGQCWVGTRCYTLGGSGEPLGSHEEGGVWGEDPVESGEWTHGTCLTVLLNY